MQDAQDLLREGRLDEALAQLKDQVRQDPSKADLRVYLFQLLWVMGDWDRALTQLNVAAELDGEKLLLAEICRPALQCEAFRTAVFEGRKSPLVFGEPPEWVGWLTQANQLIAKEQYAAALELRNRAFEAAPAISGRINGEPFEWIADGDTRLGPIVEVVVEHKYFWVPWSRILSVRVEAPKALRNVVWAEAQFTWTNGGMAPGLIPARYVGSESSDEPMVRLARKTEWTEREGGHYLGLGQRVFTTDRADYPLLEVRRIELDNEPAVEQAESSAEGVEAPVTEAADPPPGGPSNG
ncbi:MAG TPA: type VI secretion system accessory protein TagJ [Phycisphaerae bacterium]|nr:type VI secretion system accessory protein TagJ [Phycisphaerae bacterium]